jgi:hypothetical protein
MWETSKDIFFTVIVLLLLISGAVAIPLIILFITVLAVGYLIFASLHDARINKEMDDDSDEST